MKMKCRTLLAVITLLLNSNISFSTNFLLLSEIREGQKGVGITRWNDDKIKEFEIEIVSILKSTPKSGVIIARINDEEIRNTGVVAGMSGSPVYVNNKIIGAISFTWTFLKEPMVGITPLEEMIPLEKYAMNEIFLPSSIKYTTPILASGISKTTKEILESKLSKWNVLLVESFSSFTTKEKDRNSSIFRPGDGIGINLVSGDIELTVIGTVTYIESNKVFGLGHPAFLIGKTSIPISTVETVAIVPRQNLSFKIAVPREIVGSLEFDGGSGVFCVLGKKAPLVKATVNVDRKNLYTYYLAKDNNLLPILLSAVVNESILRTKALGGEGNVELKCSLSFKFEGLDKEFALDFKDIVPVYQLGQGYAISLSDVNSILEFLMYNPLFKVDINRIHIDVETKPLDVGFIAFVIPSKVTVSPGEELKISVGIKKLRGDIILREFKVKIPTWVASGTKITIGAVNKALRSIQKINSYPEAITFDTYEKLYNFISEDLRVEKLVLYLEIPSASYASGGYVYELLPNYLSTAFALTPRSKNLIPFIVEEEITEEFPIGGISSTSVFVK
ncbi:MAG: SpoIVB peptidase S55 domain-containing protein [Brevinematia bacterium]